MYTYLPLVMHILTHEIHIPVVLTFDLKLTAAAAVGRFFATSGGRSRSYANHSTR
jgi:hypothetical protein